MKLEKTKFRIKRIIYFALIFNIIIPYSFICQISLVESDNYNLMSRNSIESTQDELKTSDPSTYVIITTEAIQSHSVNLTKFVNYKKSLGFNVEIINNTIKGYGTAAGKQRALNIRTWLKNNYISKNIEYVLLIGDPNPDDESNPVDLYGDVPMLMCWPNGDWDTNYQCPTDYFYADLSGTWDYDGDGFYGEYDEDGLIYFNPEVYVGRIPVYSADYNSLDNILYRIIRHHNFSRSEKFKILESMAISNYANELPNYAGAAKTDGLNCPYYIYENIIKNLGMTDTVMYELTGLSAVAPSAFHCDMDLSKNNFINEFNKGYGAVFWWAHGDEEGAYYKYWNSDDGDGTPEAAEMIEDTFIEYSDMSQLETDQPAFFFQCSCENGHPENENNLGYALLRHGAAISTVCASRVSWYRSGTWSPSNLPYVSDNAVLGFNYMYNLLWNEMPSGKALYSAKASGGEYWGVESWMNKMDFNLYGDPQLQYWTTPPNKQTSSSAPPSEDDDDSDSSSDVITLNSGRLLIIVIGVIAAGAGITIGIALYTKKKKDKIFAREGLSTDLSPTQNLKSPTVPPIPPITCSKCGANLQGDQKICTNCENNIERSPSESAIISEIPKVQQQSLPVIAPRYCVKCGSSLDSKDVFCTKCGTKIFK